MRGDLWDVFWPINPIVYGPVIIWFLIRPFFSFYSGKTTYGSPHGVFIWIPHVFMVDSRTILTNDSLEAYLLLRFQKVSLALCGLELLVYTLPLASLYRGASGPDPPFRYGHFIYYNISKGWSLLVPTLFCLLYTGILLYVLVQEMYFYHRVRDAVVLRGRLLERASTRTVLFRTLTRNIFEDDVRDELGAANVEAVLIQCDTTQLEDIFYQLPHFRTAVERGLLRLMRQSIKTGTGNDDPGPAQNLQWLDFMWRAVLLERARLKKQDALETGFVFVLFRDFQTAMSAYLCHDYTLEPIAISVKPRDLLYGNLHDLLPRERLTKVGWCNHLVCVVVPAAFYIQISAFLVYMTTNTWSRLMRDISLILFNLCMRWFIFQTLPLRRLQRSIIDQLSTNMLLEMDLYTIFFVCGGLFRLDFPAVLHDIMHAIYAVSVQSDLLIFVSLVFSLLARASAITPREIWESRQLPKNNVTVRYKTFLLILIIVMATSPITPLISIGAFTFLFANYFFWKYNILYVYGNADDSLGVYHAKSLLWLCRCGAWGGPLYLLAAVWTKHEFATILHQFAWLRTLEPSRRGDLAVNLVALAVFLLVSLAIRAVHDHLGPFVHLNPYIIPSAVHRLDRAIRSGSYRPPTATSIFRRLHRYLWPDYPTIRAFVPDPDPDPVACAPPEAPGANLDAYRRPWEEMDPFPIWLPADEDGVAEALAEAVRDACGADGACAVGCGARMDRQGRVTVDEGVARRNEWLRGMGMRDA